MLSDGVAAGAAGGVGAVAEPMGFPVNGSATWAMRLVSVSTVGTARRHSPTRPRPMMPAMSPMALRRCLPARRCGRVRLGPDMAGVR